MTTYSEYCLARLFFEHHGRALKPIVFMSHDILNDILRGNERALAYNKETPTKFSFTVCGYKVKTVADLNVLSIGFDLL